MWIRDDPSGDGKEFSGHHPFELDAPSFHDEIFSSNKLFARKIMRLETQDLIKEKMQKKYSAKKSGGPRPPYHNSTNPSTLV